MARVLLVRVWTRMGWHEACLAVCPRTGRACSTWNSLRAWICRLQGIPPLHPLLPPPIGAPTRSRRPRHSHPVRHLSPSSPPPPLHIGVGRRGVECRGTDIPCFTWSGVGGGRRRGVLVQWVSSWHASCFLSQRRPLDIPPLLLPSYPHSWCLLQGLCPLVLVPRETLCCSWSSAPVSGTRLARARSVPPSPCTKMVRPSLVPSLHSDKCPGMSVPVRLRVQRRASETSSRTSALRDLVTDPPLR